jgi:hypothetical protein
VVAHFGFRSSGCCVCRFVCLLRSLLLSAVTGIVDQELEPELLRRKLLREYSRVTATEQNQKLAAQP